MTTRNKISGVLRTALILVALLARSTAATPEEQTWRRATLIGETREHYYRWLNERIYPGADGRYTERLRFQKVGRSERDRSVVEESVVREVTFTTDPETGVSTATEKSLPAFDLGSKLKSEGVVMAFPVDAPSLVFQGSEAWMQVGSERERVLDAAELGQRLWPVPDDLRALGAESALGESYYYRVASRIELSEDLLVVSQTEIRAAYERLEQRRTHAKPKPDLPRLTPGR